MKKAKKIGLSLNKKVISELGKSEISGGTGTTQWCTNYNNEWSCGSCQCGPMTNGCQMTTYDCKGKL